MNNDLKDILTNSNKDIDNQQLMDYLSHQLDRASSHKVEESMAVDEFLNDAVEGLQKLDNQKNLQAYVEQLNRDLVKQVSKNKARNESRKLKDQPFTYFAIIIILILLVVCFIVMKKNMELHPVINTIIMSIDKVPALFFLS